MADRRSNAPDRRGAACRAPGHGGPADATRPVRALVKLGYACNNDCSFCHSAEHRGHPALSTAGALAKLREAKALGATQILFSGGEPTVRRDLVKLFDAARRLGLGTGLVTNGRVLAYPDVTARLVEAGLSYAYVSLHGADPAVHDACVGVPGAHAQALGGLRNLLARAQIEVTVNVVVIKATLPHLCGVPELLAARRPYRLKFSCVEPKGRADDRFDEIVPRLSEAAPRVLQALAAARAVLPPGSPEPGYDGFPPCLMGGRVDAMDDLLTHGIQLMSETFETGFYPCDHGHRAKPPACATCALDARCPGLYAGYLARLGGDEVRPIAVEPDAGF